MSDARDLFQHAGLLGWRQLGHLGGSYLPTLSERTPSDTVGQVLPHLSPLDMAQSNPAECSGSTSWSQLPGELKGIVFVCIVGTESQMQHWQVWDPATNPRDRLHIMPIITPTYPAMNSSYNVIPSTFRILESEFSTGASRTFDIETKASDISTDIIAQCVFIV